MGKYLLTVNFSASSGTAKTIAQETIFTVPNIIVSTRSEMSQFSKALVETNPTPMQAGTGQSTLPLI